MRRGLKRRAETVQVQVVMFGQLKAVKGEDQDLRAACFEVQDPSVGFPGNVHVLELIAEELSDQLPVLDVIRGYEDARGDFSSRAREAGETLSQSSFHPDICSAGIGLPTK